MGARSQQLGAEPGQGGPQGRRSETRSPEPRREANRRDEGFLTWRRVLGWGAIPVAFLIMRFVPPRPVAVREWLLLLLAGVLFTWPVIHASYREFRKAGQAKSAAELAIEYEARLGLALGEAVSPIAHLLGYIAEARGKDRALLQGQLCQRAVDACAELCGENARACFFVLDGASLRPVAWAGRATPPQTVFEKDAPEDGRVHDLVESRRRLLVPDTARPPAGVSVRSDAHYSTFLAVPVYAASRNLGMLTVDAPEVGSLEQSDLDIATALALMLGVGL